MKKFACMIAIVFAGGCTLELDDLKDLFTIEVTGDEVTCMEQFESCIEEGGSTTECAARLGDCRNEEEPANGADPSIQCAYDYEMCIETDFDEGRCEERFEDCLTQTGDDPPHPTDPDELCEVEFEMCIDSQEHCADGVCPADEECEARLRECAAGTNTEPVQDCYTDYEMCVEAQACGDDEGCPGDDCEALLRDCLGGGEEPGDASPDDQCALAIEDCLRSGISEEECRQMREDCF